MKTKIKPVKISDYKVVNNQILIKGSGRLPRRCVITNQPATAKDKISFKFTENRKLFNDENAALKAALDMTKVFTGVGSKTFEQEESISFSYYLCKELRRKRFFIKSLFIILIIISLCLLIYFLQSEGTYIYLIIPISTVLFSLHVIKKNDHPFKILGYEKGFYILEGGSNKFKESLEEL